MTLRINQDDFLPMNGHAMNEQEFKAGDRIRVYRGGRSPIEGTVTYISPLLGIGFTEDGFYSAHDESPFHPRQCELISRPQKTEKKKVWVAAWDKNPNGGSFSMHRYVQIEAEVPCE